MAVVSVNEVASTFNLANYHGSLFTIKGTNNLFSGLVGALAPGGGRVTDSYEFGINTQELPDADQPAILEGADIPTPVSFGMTHQKNVTQIFDKSYGVTYSKSASPEKVHEDSYQKGNEPTADPNPFSRQRDLCLQTIRNQVNYSFLNGSYNNPADATTDARKMRGVLEAVDSSNVVSAAGAFSTAKFNELLRAMYGNGALDDTDGYLILCGAFQKQKISEAYGYAPADRHLGGVNIKQIETDFGVFPIGLDRHMPASVILIVKWTICTPVYNLVRGRDNEVKGILFSEPVPTAKTIIQDHIYGEIGIDHGPGIWHGKLTNLTTS